jgi:hypothetical protein
MALYFCNTINENCQTQTHFNFGACLVLLSVVILIILIRQTIQSSNYSYYLLFYYKCCFTFINMGVFKLASDLFVKIILLSYFILLNILSCGRGSLTNNNVSWIGRLDLLALLLQLHLFTITYNSSQSVTA